MTSEIVQMEPIRLTPDEQRELGRRYYAAVAAKDDAAAAECLDKLTRLIYPMIVAKVAPRWSRSSHFADVVSYVYLGMFDALIRIRSYDPDKGAFATWATYQIDRRLIDYNQDVYAIVRVPQGSYSHGIPAAVAAMNARAEPWPDHLEPSVEPDEPEDRAAVAAIIQRIANLAEKIPNPTDRSAVIRYYGLGDKPATPIRAMITGTNGGKAAVLDRIERGTRWIRDNYQGKPT